MAARLPISCDGKSPGSPRAGGRRTEAIWHTSGGGCITAAGAEQPCLRYRHFDIALWDLKARRANLPLLRLLGGFDPRVPCYAGGIDLDLPLEALLKQTDDNLAKGFRAIKMKVGRPDLGADVARVEGDARTSRRGLSADGRCQHEMDGGGSDPRGPGARSLATLPGSKSRSSPTTLPAIPASCAQGGTADRGGRKPAFAAGVQELHRRGRCPIPSPTSPIAAGSPPS